MNISKKTLLVLIIIVLQTITLLACKGQSAEIPEIPEIPAMSEIPEKPEIQEKPLVATKEEEINLRIMYYSEQQFMDQYGNSFKKKFPTSKIEVIPSILFHSGGATSSVELSDIMEQKPDIVFGPRAIPDLAKMKKMVDLEPYMRQSDIEPEQFAATAIEWMRDLGQGHLVSLSPSFQTVALYYNKTLFDELKTPYPSSNMSWESTLQLAGEISRKDMDRTIYGLYMNDTVDRTVSLFLSGHGIRPYSEDLRTARYGSDDYKAMVSTVVDAFRTNAIYLPPEERVRASSLKESLLQNKFIAGEAAMTIRHPGLIDDLANAVKQGIEPFEWDIVPEPTNAQQPGQSSSIIVGDMFGIPSDSPNKNAAWQFIQFVTGPEMAAELASTKPNVLSIRTDAVHDRDERNLDAFLAHRPAPINTGETFPNQVGQQISQLVSERMLDIIYGRTSVTNEMEAIQSQVQGMLDEAWGG